MNELQSIKRKLLPLLKGLPIIVVLFITAIIIARTVINYTPNTYQTIARIKLDDQKHGFSSTSLYANFDVFSTENKIQAEAAVLNSALLIGMALDSLDFTTSLYRKGKVKNTMLYDDSPIKISYDFVNNQLLDKDYFIRITANGFYQFVNVEGENIDLPEKSLGASTLLDGGVITIEKNTNLPGGRDFQLEGDYIFHIYSRDGLIADVSERLDIIEVDKEIPIIRVVYKDEHPQKVADLANSLCKTYIQDYVNTKSQAAKQMTNFIDQKLAEVLEELQRTEIALEEYKAVNGVVNTRQETETGLRQISNLKIQLINLEMNQKAILELEEYISGGDYFKERAINFGFGDLLMTELVKKLKLWQDERIDLLVKYTAESDEVLAVDKKIEEVKIYIVEAIKRNKVEINTKKAGIEKSLAEASKQFDGLSTREKEMRILERDFRLQEQVYTFLSQKKIEASIASSANLAFHRIIQTAEVPREPVAPNKTLITFVAGLLGLIIGIAFIYLRKYSMGRVIGREDIERHSLLPLLGLIRSGNAEQDFIGLSKTLKLKDQLKPNSSIVVTSTIEDEGKSYVAKNLATCLSGLNLKVALVFMQKPIEEENPSSASLEKYLENKMEANTPLIELYQENDEGLDFKEKVEQLKSMFDLVIIDAPATAVNVEGVEAMKLADTCLYIVRSNKTKIEYLSHADRLVEEYNMENIMFVLNDANKALNHSGNFMGARFRHQRIAKKISLKVGTFVNSFLA